ncbi:DUF3825 domain-containing protein [Streptomyces sp. NPDC059604]|uniref:DUF3825 domain-containing protein n=1 Tax=Streptomyces sp. NPDC059604 TaxID=3346881 RepID=UPI0036B12468
MATHQIAPIDIERAPGHASNPEAPRERATESFLYEFAWLGRVRTQEERESRIGNLDIFDLLAEVASPEPWWDTYSKHPENIGVLQYYINNTFARAIDDGAVLLDRESRAAVFNTGLSTENQESIYGVFFANSREDLKPWLLKNWHISGSSHLERFSELPGPAVYSKDPSDYYLDWNLPLESRISSIAHSVSANFSRAAEEIPYGLGLAMKAAVEHARDLAARIPGTAVPSWNTKKSAVQILLPLFLSAPARPDAAIALTRIRDSYVAEEVIPLDSAYRRARLVTRPHAPWLTF